MSLINIDRLMQYAKSRKESAYYHMQGLSKDSPWRFRYDTIMEEADNLIILLENTTPVDAVEVVRCKYCVHYYDKACLKIYNDGAVSEYAWQERDPYDFCSYGEK